MLINNKDLVMVFPVLFSLPEKIYSVSSNYLQDAPIECTLVLTNLTFAITQLALSILKGALYSSAIWLVISLSLCYFTFRLYEARNIESIKEIIQKLEEITGGFEKFISDATMAFNDQKKIVSLENTRLEGLHTTLESTLRKINDLNELHLDTKTYLQKHLRELEKIQGELAATTKMQRDILASIQSEILGLKQARSALEKAYPNPDINRLAQEISPV